MLPSKDIVSDWIKVGTMLTVSHWLGGGSLSDNKWQLTSLYTLMGFTAYHLSTRNFLTPINSDGTFRRIADDTIKFGTMFIVSRLLSGGSLTDTDWISACMGTIIGFAVYNIVVNKHIDGKKLTYSPKLQMVIDDWAKVGTMLLVARLISCESLFDAQWLSSSLAIIIGFSTYDLVTSNIIDNLFK